MSFGMLHNFPQNIWPIWRAMSLLLMLIHFLCELRSRPRLTFGLDLAMICDLDISSSVGKTTILPKYSSSDPTYLKEMVGIFKPHVCSFGEEEVNSWDNYHQIQRGKENIGAPMDVLDRNLQKMPSQLPCGLRMETLTGVIWTTMNSMIHAPTLANAAPLALTLKVHTSAGSMNGIGNQPKA